MIINSLFAITVCILSIGIKTGLWHSIMKAQLINTRNVSRPFSLLKEEYDCFISCKKNYTKYDFCQTHYLLMWNSSIRQFSEYKPILRDNNSTSLSLSLHTT